MAIALYDAINSGFELVGVLASLLDIVKIYKDRKVSGVYWPSRCFFIVWGVWNLLYYPSLHQWCSLFGGIALTTCNVIWVCIVCYYNYNYNHNYTNPVEVTSDD